MTRRQYLAVRVSPTGLSAIHALAKAETGGNVSAMVRKLLSEALAARKSV